MKCAYQREPYIVFGPDKDTKLSLPMDSKKSLRKFAWNGNPIKVDPHIEFALGSCVQSEYNDRVNLFYMAPRYNINAHYETLKIAEKLQAAKKKPMMMLFLTIDSFSRRHFFRKMEVTLEYLHKLQQGGDYKVFDFKLHNIIGADTAENQLRVFGEK